MPGRLTRTCLHAMVSFLCRSGENAPVAGCPASIPGRKQPLEGVPSVPSSERRKEIKRRRHRRQKKLHFARKLRNATVSETVAIAEKLRALTPGGQEIVDRWEIDKR